MTASAAVCPDWDDFPLLTTLTARDEQGSTLLSVRTGSITSSHRFVPRITWRTQPEPVQAAWLRLQHEHWARLAHDRGGYS